VEGMRPSVLWWSASPDATTGYGNQGDLWTQHLERNGYDVYYACNGGHQVGTRVRNGIQLYVADVTGTTMPSLQRHINPDLIFAHTDLWALNVGAISQVPHLACWTPIDTDRHPLSRESGLSKADLDVIKVTGVTPIAMSEHGRDKLLDSGLEDVLYIPHGFDLDVYKPSEEVKPDPNIFTIFINATNYDMVRKALTQQLFAFAEFHHRHPESRMVIHAQNVWPTGTNLPAMIYHLGLEACVVLPDPYMYASGLYPDSYIVDCYRKSHLTSLCSAGEGFGMPIVEAMACGSPVITTDWSSMRELVPAHRRVAGDYWWVGTHQSCWRVPFIDAILEQYEIHFAMSEEERQREIRDNLLTAAKFEYGRIWDEYFAPVMKRLIP
jgi:glycosyltransferase involved in cell wall biosynthesis